MAAIRWEESVLRSRLAREGVCHPTILHRTCHCGAIGCVAVPGASTGSGLVYSYRSDREGALFVERRGVILEARLDVDHDPEGKYALRLRDPTGVERHLVSAPDASPHRWRGTRSIALPDLVGVELAGTWRLAVLDHTLGAGEHRRVWTLLTSLR